jgi:hypothetical protein
MNNLSRGLIVPTFLFLIPFIANAADALPTTRLLPVVTESSAGEPLSVEDQSTPFLAHLGDIGELGYVEEEYEMSGVGNIYDYVDNESQSSEVIISESNVPYVTRMLIRRPADPSAFNGTVYIEILNSTAHWDDDPIWRMSYPSFVEAGSAYVGITSDPLTINFLRNVWGESEFEVKGKIYESAPRNRDRYQKLTMDRFGQVWDVLSQGAALLKEDANPENPMTGFGVERIIQTGYSQSAGFQKTYANVMHSRDVKEYGSAVYDGYYLGAGGFSAKQINPPPPGEGIDYVGANDLRRFVDVPVPVIRFQTETEMLAFFQAQTGRQLESGEPNSPQVRTYEMAGGVHVDLRLETTGLLIRERDMGFSAEPATCPQPVIPISVSYIQSALLRATEAWVRDGTEPPRSQRIKLGTETNARGKVVEVVVFDQNGNAEEGLRSPQLEVPLGQYIANPFALLNDCFLNGGFVAFDEERFRELYPTDQDYLLATDRAISRAVADGIVLAEDADNLRQDMLADAGVVDDSVDDNDNVFGCTLSSNGRPDPTFPALVLIALAYVTRRRWLRLHS